MATSVSRTSAVITAAGILLGGLCVWFFAFTGIGLFLIIVAILWLLGRSFPIRQFGHEITEGDPEEPWPVVYETNLDFALATMIASQLRGHDIPVIMENEHLFNSGIHWEIGLSVPLRVRVPRDHEDQAHEIVRVLINNGTANNNAPTGSSP